MRHAPRIIAEEPNDWDRGNVRETDNNFSIDLQLLMTETANDHHLLKNISLPQTPTTRQYAR